MNLTTLAELTQFGPVFPLKPGSKKPLVKWKKQATQHLVTLERWLDKWPDSNWALVPTHAFIVDIDVKNGKEGFESIGEAGWLPKTMIVVTPSGGLHYYYAPDDSIPYKTSNGWLPGIDIRYGPNGYVVLPFSRTPDGQYELLYDYDDIPDRGRSLGSAATQSILAPIPDWIKERLQEPNPDEPVNNTLLCNCRITKCTPTRDDIPDIQDWTGISTRTRYMFFRNATNVRIPMMSISRSEVDGDQCGAKRRRTFSV